VVRPGRRGAVAPGPAVHRGARTAAPQRVASRRRHQPRRSRRRHHRRHHYWGGPVTYLVGKIALDIAAGAPDNGRGDNNVAMVKQMWISREPYPYVSAQAFRRWLRDSLPADEPRSGVTRSGSGKNQQAYTEGRPDRYLDDDLFGYMVAVSRANYQRD